MIVNWIKNTQGAWLPLDAVDLSNVTGNGVYAIWHGGPSPRWVKVGQGDIADRVGCHKRDAVITKYAQQGRLYVTWAYLSAAHLDGVERYVGEQLNPLVAERFPQAVPVRVNLPAEAA